jgi:hypothetical protein
MPSLGVSSLDLGRLTRAAFFYVLNGSMRWADGEIDVEPALAHTRVLLSIAARVSRGKRLMSSKWNGKNS